MAMPERLARSAGKARTLPAARAQKASRWPLAQTPASVLGEHWGVSSCRARHMRTDDPTNPFSVILEMVEDPNVNGPAMAASVLEALERRYMQEAQDDPAALRARLDYLLSKIHDTGAVRNRALQTRQGVDAALLEDAAQSIEIVAIRRALGIEE